MNIRKVLKILHEFGSIGVIGALVTHLLLVINIEDRTPAEYAIFREAIALVSGKILLPSLAVVLVSGLFAMAAHKPFLELKWVWLKAALGIGMFEGTLGTVESTSRRAAELSAAALHETVDATLMAELARTEWYGLWIILCLAIINVIIAVWRPRMKARIPT